MARGRPTKVDEQAFRELWEASVPAVDIAAQLGIGKNTVTSLRKRLGLDVRRVTRGRPYDGDVLRLHESGLHTAAIARKLDISRDRVRISLRRAGVSPHRAESTKPLSQPKAKRGGSLGGFEMKAELKLARLAEPCNIVCSRCGWASADGSTLGEARQAFAEHACAVAA